MEDTGMGNLNVPLARLVGMWTSAKFMLVIVCES